MTRGHARMQVMMENKNGSDVNSNASASETSQSFVVRMWQEDPGEWRGTVRHVQSDTQFGFTRVDQVRAFIQRYTTGEPRQIANPAPGSAARFNFAPSRRMTRMLAFAFALIILAIAGLFVVTQGSAGQLLGFGH